MAGDSKKVQPIIIKRPKKGVHTPHGGAWKIAFADFMTAMMAFFLLMWLLGSTTEGDRKGIADYFSNPVKVSMMGGSGAGDATSIIKGGGTNLTESTGQQSKGTPDSLDERMRQKAMRAEQQRQEQARLKMLKTRVEQVISADPRLSKYKNQLRLDLTAEGLRIQIVDDQNRAMFNSGSDQVQPYMRDVLRAIGYVLADVPNRLTIEGHTDAKPYMYGEAGYSNWELSADRANASRRELITGGLKGERVLRVQGLAASMLFDLQNPEGPLNRRISIIVMNREAEQRFYDSALTAANAPISSEDETEDTPVPNSINRVGTTSR